MTSTVSSSATSHHTTACVSPCPVNSAVAALGGKWKTLIVFYLSNGELRFSQLQRLIPEVTRHMLTQHLRQLEADGVVSRTVHAVVPPRVDYALTPLGQELTPIFELLENWGEKLLQHQAGVVPSSMDVK